MGRVTVALSLREILVQSDMYEGPGIWVVRLLYMDADEPEKHRVLDRYPGEDGPLVPWVFEDVAAGTYVPEAVVYDLKGGQLGEKVIGEPFVVPMSVSVPASVTVVLT